MRRVPLVAGFVAAMLVATAAPAMAAPPDTYTMASTNTGILAVDPDLLRPCRGTCNHWGQRLAACEPQWSSFY